MLFNTLFNKLSEFIDKQDKELEEFGYGNHAKLSNISQPFIEKDYGNIKVYSIMFDFKKGEVPREIYYFTVNDKNEILTINFNNFYQTLEEFLWSVAYIYMVCLMNY